MNAASSTSSSAVASDRVSDAVRADRTQGRIWCFTIHAAADTSDSADWPLSSVESQPLGKWPANKYFRYCCYQVEKCPRTGRIHLQGFLCLTKGVRLNDLKNHYHRSAHWERSRGTISQNRDYCTKAESRVAGPFELGDVPQSGGEQNKHKWEEVARRVKEGHSANQILMAMPSLAPCARGIDRLIEASRPSVPISRAITVFYIFGTTGVGKTHHALKRFPDAFLVRGKYMDGKSFDLYNFESTLILDEWDPYEWPLTLMNSLLDKWKCPLACRYQNKFAAWTTVVICSNIRPMDAYTASHQLQRDSFQRRLTHTIEILERIDELVWGDENDDTEPDDNLLNVTSD